MNAESDAQRTALRRMRRVVTGLLVAAAVCLVLACTGEAYYPVLGFVHAFCEAAMAGGLADWFAVTSRFRHPPGVPLPHTAVISASKDRIGASFGCGVERNFFASDIVRGKLAQAACTVAAADWLCDPARTAPATRQILRFLPRLLETVDDVPLREFLAHNLHEALARIEMSPVLAGVLELVATPDRQHVLLDGPLVQPRDILADSESIVRQRVRERTAWLWRKLGVNQAISDRLLTVA